VSTAAVDMGGWYPARRGVANRGVPFGGRDQSRDRKGAPAAE
jgi:hypothetical protein